VKFSHPLALLLFALPSLAQAPTPTLAPDRIFFLDQSTLTYPMSHPIHEVDGISHAAKGKGVCHAGTCEFLLAAPVKTFDSGDTNRDLHMLQVTKGAQFPIVTVRFRLPESAIDSPTLDCDLEVQLAGQTDHFYHVPFHQEITGATRHITGVVPSTVSGFKIDPPSFLGVAIKNEIPVRVDTTWHAS